MGIRRPKVEAIKAQRSKAGSMDLPDMRQGNVRPNGAMA